jgi:23S rRNA (guanosine2251-2'-O)-methyltransferase
MKKLSVDEMNRMEPEEFQNSSKIPVVLVLDNIRSLHNVGAAFRTGDAFRIEKIYLCGITGTPPNRELHKSALGAEETVAWEYHNDTLSLIHSLRQQGWTIAILEQTNNSISLEKFKPSAGEKYCFVAGNEVFGVEDEVVKACDICLEIPQFGTKHSLNVSVSIGIVLWDYMSKAGLRLFQP